MASTLAKIKNKVPVKKKISITCDVGQWLNFLVTFGKCAHSPVGANRIVDTRRCPMENFFRKESKLAHLLSHLVVQVFNDILV
jgi:hypothetical protein